MPHSAYLNLIQARQYQSQSRRLSRGISQLTYRAAYAPFKPSATINIRQADFPDDNKLSEIHKCLMDKLSNPSD